MLLKAFTTRLPGSRDCTSSLVVVDWSSSAAIWPSRWG